MILLPSNEIFWTAVGSIGTVAALAYLAQQNISMKKSLSFDSQWRKKDKAVQLAEKYASEMMPRIGYCSSVLSKAAIYKKISSIKPSRMLLFTRDELMEIDQGIINISFEKSVMDVEIKVFEEHRDVLPERCRGRIESYSDEDGKRVLLAKEFAHVANTLLNDLEYFSMCVNCGIVDGDVLYPSLHQTFFSTVQIFYYAIASVNYNARDKYYTHIITLYRAWQKRHREDEERERRQQVKHEESIYSSYNPIQ